MTPQPLGDGAPSQRGRCGGPCAASMSTADPPIESSFLPPYCWPLGAPLDLSTPVALPQSQATSSTWVAGEPTMWALRYRRRLLPQRGHRSPVEDEGETKATGRSSKPQPEHRSVRTVTFVRILTGTRVLRLELTAFRSVYPSGRAVREHCRRRSSKRLLSSRPAGPWKLPWLPHHSSSSTSPCQ